MPSENQAGTDAPAVVSATIEPASTPSIVETPEVTTQGTEGETETAVAPKTYSEEEVQERIERATAKAAAKAERRAFREANELLQRTQPPAQRQQQETEVAPRGESESDAAYVKRLVKAGMDEERASSRQQSAQQAQQASHEKAEKIYQQAEAIPGFDREEFDALLDDKTPTIAAAIMESDVAAKLMAHFAAHPAEMDSLKALSPIKQAAAIGKLETKLETTAAKPKAPPPIDPVGNGQSPIKSVATANMDDFIKMRQKAGSRWIR